MFLAACGEKAPVETTVPTETPGPVISFVSPLDGATINYDDLRFQVNPVEDAEGYAWVFIQNGNVLWDTLKDEQRLVDAEYNIPGAGSLNDKFPPGEIQVQVKTRINGVWTKPATLTFYLSDQATTNIPTNTQAGAKIPAYIFLEDQYGVIYAGEIRTGKAGTLVDPKNNPGGGLFSNCWNFSPDGKKLFYIASGVPNIYDLVTRQTVRLPYTVYACEDFVWHPDGRTIMARNGSNYELFSPLERKSIFTFDPDPDGANPAFSRDGMHVAFESIYVPEIYVYDVGIENGQATYIQRQPAMTLQTRQGLSFRKQLSFSPDDRGIIFWAANPKYELVNDLYLITLDDNVTTKLIDAMQMVTGETFLTQGFDWSPDGTFIAFWGNIIGQKTDSSFSYDNRESQVYVLNLKDRHITPITDVQIPSGSSPIWSPDGRLLFFISDDSLVQCKPDGNEKTSYPLNAVYASAKFNPNPGLTVIFQPQGGLQIKIPAYTPAVTANCALGWSRLQASEYAVTLPGPSNRVRSEPKTGNNLIASLPADTLVKVLEGPICTDGLIFWRVEHNSIPGGSGWTAEGDGKEYWLEPMK